MFVEAIAAFVLMFVIMGIAVDSNAPGNWAGLVIGLTVGGLIMLTAGATGASFNPARTFGPYVINSLAGGNISWAQFPIYVIGPTLGAIGGAVAYKGLTTRQQVAVSDPHSVKV
jgi:glycerol uptake facilitator protein